MKPRVTGEAVIPAKVRELLERFDYPDELPVVPEVNVGGGGGMAHVLIVSDSEPPQVQDKADYTCPSSNSAAALQRIFDEIATSQGNSGQWSIWMAGVFDLDQDVTAPDGAWIRGLGYYAEGVSA